MQAGERLASHEVSRDVRDARCVGGLLQVWGVWNYAWGEGTAASRAGTKCAGLGPTVYEGGHVSVARGYAGLCDEGCGSMGDGKQLVKHGGLELLFVC